MKGIPKIGSFHLLQALESERMRIARDIHDGPLQQFAALVMDLDLHAHNAQRSRSPEVQEVGQQLMGLHQTGLTTLKAMRECLYIVRSPEVEELGLNATLRQCVNNLRHQTGLDIRLEVSEGYRELPSLQALALYRIMHEALVNVHKHAEAEHAWVRLDFEGKEVRLSVTDDGRGFDLETGRHKEKHMGLGTMRDRAEMAGGRCTLESQPGQGTTVQVVLPILEPAPGAWETEQPAPSIRNHFATVLGQRRLSQPVRGVADAA
jgi:two-component system sensor histidine kinase DegS